MTEKLLQFIWQFQYYNAAHLHTIEGEALQVISPGLLNRHQGPDFTDARIRIGTTLFAGSVELHLRTSEWTRHGHQADPQYTNVILHVVYVHDTTVNRLPVLQLAERIPKLLLEQYQALMQQATFIPCAAAIARTKALVLHAWKERLLAERLTRKAQDILHTLQKTAFHWEETCWRILARHFGARVNGDAFEGVAATLPVALLARHKPRIQQLEALLLGQAGMLEGDYSDAYALLLQREYRFLKNKYGLRPCALPVLFLRMRPANFPTVRLAQLAMLVHRSEHLFSKLLETADLKAVRQWLEVTANDYWHYRYRPDEASAYQPKKVGTAMAEHLVINVFVPLLFAYGLYHNKEAYKERALQWLEALAPESNAITDGFAKLSLDCRSAFDSQALIELKNGYCQQRRCLECAVGNYLLRTPAG